MNSNNVVTFKNSRIETPSKDPDSSAAQLRSSYCDEMANELFGIVMRIIERSGHMDHVDTSDEDFFDELQPRLTMVKEALYSVFCLLENVDYDLSTVFDNLFKPLGYTEGDLQTHLFVTVDDKYRNYLIEMTKKYIKENNG